MPPFFFSGSAPTAGEYVALNYRIWRQRPRTRFNDWVLGLALGLLATSVGLQVARTGTLWPASPPLVLLALGVAYALGRGPLVRRQLRRLYARNPALHAPATYVLGPDTLGGRSELGQFESRWSAIRRAVRVGPHWLLLYPTESACYYLDLRRLQLPATAADVQALLGRQAVPWRELRGR